MKISCEVISDLIPLVKDNVASEETIKLVSEHIKDCEECKMELGDYNLGNTTKINDMRVVSNIKKRLFLISSTLLYIGAFIGMALNKNSSSNLIPLITILLSIVFVGVIFLNFNLKGDKSMEKFFIGKTIGTIIVFAILGVYLLVRYILNIF